ncbi:MAG: hypothetical protein GY851_22675 [bacterium]|nr:hypothetical protein [bacterium]
MRFLSGSGEGAQPGDANSIRHGREVAGVTGTYQQIIKIPAGWTLDGVLEYVSAEHVVLECVCGYLDMCGCEIDRLDITFDDEWYESDTGWGLSQSGANAFEECHARFSLWGYGSPIFDFSETGLEAFHIDSFASLEYTQDFTLDLSDNVIPGGDDTDEGGTYGTVCDIINTLYQEAFIGVFTLNAYLYLTGDYMGGVEENGYTDTHAQAMINGQFGGWFIDYISLVQPVP